MVRLLFQFFAIALLTGFATGARSQLSAGTDEPNDLPPGGEIIGMLDEEEIDLLQELADLPLLPPRPAPAEEAVRQPGEQRWKARLLVRLTRSVEEQDEREDSLFPGSLAAVNARFGLRLGPRLQAAVAACRQRGELWKDGRFAGTLSYRGPGLLKSLLLGDYTLGAGEGLVFSRLSPQSFSGRGVRNGKLVASQRPEARGSMRGVALAAQVPAGPLSIEATAAWSRRALDGTLRDDGSVGGLDWYASARTASERARRRTVIERLLGGRLVLAVAGLRVGLSWFRSQYSRPVVPLSGIGFSGDRSEMLGADCTVDLQNLTLSGEIARSLDRGLSAVAALELRAARRCSVRVALRSFGADFANPRGVSAGRHRDGGNEQGCSVTLRAAPASRLALEAGADLFRWPGPVFRDPLPSTGMTLSLGCQARLDSVVSGQLRLRLRHWSLIRSGLSASAADLRERVEASRFSMTALLLCRLTADFALRTHLSGCSARYSRALPEGRAVLLSAGLLYRRDPWRGEVRCMLFDGVGGDMPLVDAEPEPGAPAGVPLLVGRGTRYMGAAEWKAGPFLAFGAKCSVNFPGPFHGVTSPPPPIRLAFSILASL